MTRMQTCPKVSELRQLLLGQLATQVADSMEEHLVQCQRCLSTVASLEAEDTVVEAMRAQAAVEEIEQDLVESLIHRVQQLQPPTPRPADGRSVPEELVDVPKGASDTPKEGEWNDEANSEQAGSKLKAGYNLDHPYRIPFGAGAQQEETASLKDRSRGSVAAGNIPATLHQQELPVAARALDKPIIPGYEILSELGRGGMGVVYKARQIGLKRLVALKMILSGVHAGPSELTRFRSEAEAVARLQHPNIIQIYEIGEQAGRPYFSLEYVEKGSLARWLQSTPQNPGSAAQLVETLARAIHAAHERGIVHRDLKPANILLQRKYQIPNPKSEIPNPKSESDGSGSVSDSEFRISDFDPKIGDFGLAKQLDKEAGQTATGQIVGTPSYMAPEQAQGKSRALGPGADIYALGAILYDLLTGRPPFKAATTFDTVLQVLYEEPVPPSRLQPTIPRDLETICLECLHKEPRRRYASAAALADDLRRFQAGEPILARPVGLWERGRKWVKRRPMAAALAAVSTLAALIVLGVGGALLDQRARNAEMELATEKDAQAHREAVQNQTQNRIVHAQAAREAKNWQDVKLFASKALDLAEAEPFLQTFKAQAQNLFVEAEKEIEAERSTLEAKDARLARERKLREFHILHNAALVYESQSTGLDLPANLEATRTAAGKALALFGSNLSDASQKGSDAGTLLRSVAKAWTLDFGARDSFSKQEQAEIAADCYELLLILADAMSHPLPGEDPRGQADQALQILDRATRLRKPTRAYYLRRVRYLGELAHTKRAAEEREHARALKPVDAIDHFLLGDESYQRQDWLGAIHHFRNTLYSQPSHFWAYYYLGVCYLQVQRPDQAEASFTSCLGRGLAEDRGLEWVYILRGLAQGELGARALARNQPAEAESQFKAAEEDFHKALQLKPNQQATYNLLVNRGTTRYLQGKHREAISDLETAIQMRPRQYQAYVNLAKVYEASKQWNKAAEQLDQAILLQPKAAALYRNRAFLHLQRNNLPAALHDLQETIRLDPPGSEFLAADHTQRGRILHAQKEYEAAVKAYDLALKIDPDYLPAHRDRGAALMEWPRYEEAIRAFDAYLRKGRPDAEIYEARGLARMKFKDFTGAIADFSRALEMEPKSARLYAYRGWTFLVDKAPKPALRDFEQAVRLDPKNADAYNGRGLARVRLGRVRESIADADEALRLGHTVVRLGGPESIRLFYNAARIYAQAAGRLDADAHQASYRAAWTRYAYQDRAVDLLRQALDLVPVDKRAAFWRDTIHSDDALEPIAPSRAFVQLAAPYAKAVK